MRFLKHPPEIDSTKLSLHSIISLVTPFLNFQFTCCSFGLAHGCQLIVKFCMDQSEALDIYEENISKLILDEVSHNSLDFNAVGALKENA